MTSKFYYYIATSQKDDKYSSVSEYFERLEDAELEFDEKHEEYHEADLYELEIMDVKKAIILLLNEKPLVKQQKRIARRQNKITVSADAPKPKSQTSKIYYQIRKLIQKYPQFELRYERMSTAHVHEYEVRMSYELEQRAEEMGGDEVCLTDCYDIEEVLDKMQSLVRFAKEQSNVAVREQSNA